METYYKVEELTDYFDINTKSLNKYLTEIKNNKPELITKKEDNSYLIKENDLIYLKNLIPNNFIILNNSLLNFIICCELKSYFEKDNITFQFTNRSRIIQQRDLIKFQNLPKLIQDKYYQFANKVLTWIETQFFSDKLTKIIIDRMSESSNKTTCPDIRITIYEGSQVDDLYLVLKEDMNNLQELQINNLKNEGKTNNQLISQIKKIMKSSNQTIDELAKLLKKVDEEQEIRKIFKMIIGVESSYRIVISPEIMVIGFNKLDLPTELTVNQKIDSLELVFNNNCSFTCQLDNENNAEKLIINFSNLPKDLELISL